MVSGEKIGPYTVVDKLGEGGMGQVWRATDTTLGRQVAIKILPEAFATDPDRLARFEREAKTLASLNHPHIAAIHGFEKSSGMQALVMELVEGEDLSQRIARGAILLDEALPIAKQIAEALEAAHEQGIIHRDLKPANIKVRTDGTVKVLDFGLARTVDASGAGRAGGAGGENSPTITTPAMTQAGIILGTAAYMSPEQARGRAVDKRADIWAFGAVLYEMLTGTRLFAGDSVAETLGLIFSREPDLATLPPGTPPRVRTLVARCLVKDPRQRLRDIGEARLAIESAFDTTTSQAQAPSTPSHGRRPWMAALAVAAMAIAALAVPALRYVRQSPPPAPPEIRTDIVTPATDRSEQFALSPDGRQIVFAASSDGTSLLWLRSLSASVAQPLAGTEGATYPFWSPDSRSLAFFAGGQLKRLDLGGAAPQGLAPAGIGRGGAWCADGMIVFAPSTSTPLVRVSATGGEATALTSLGPGQQSHRFPQVLPDGRRFLFYAQGAPDAIGIYLGSLDGGAPIRLTSSANTGAYLPNAAPGDGLRPGEGGWLLWAREGALVAQWLDDATSALTGERITVAGDVAADSGVGLSAVSASATGLVAYRAGGGNRRRLLWFDRSGAAVGAVGDVDATNRNPSLSPDGRRVVLSRVVGGNEDLWLIDGARTSRFTFDAATENFAVWSPDGARILFRSSRSGPGTIYQKLTSGTAEEEVLPSSSEVKTPISFSLGGRFLLFMLTTAGNPDLWVRPMTGDGAPAPLVTTRFREGWGAFSPDGQWVAYTSDESGRNEVYVRAFAPPSAGSSENQRAGQWQVSATGGAVPVWRRDGRELYFLGPTGEMMAATIAVTSATLEAGTPAKLFQTRIVGGGSDLGLGRQYDIAPDGRFLINTVLGEAAAPITMLQNWRPPGEK